MTRSMSVELGEADAVEAVLGELDAEAVLLPQDGEDVVHRRVVVDDQHGGFGDAAPVAHGAHGVEDAVVREGAHSR